MSFEEEDVVTYTPEADDNRYQEQPWSVNLVPMTAAEQRKYLMTVSSAKDGAQKAKQANQILARIFKERVISVHNLKDIRGREITTGEELFERSETEYIDEIWAALTKASQLRGGLKND